MKHRFLTLALALLTGLLAGCSGMVITGAPDVEKTAFGPKKRFAVVSIASVKTFQGERGFGDAFKDADQIPGANTQPMINKLHPKIVSTLAKSQQFTLVPEARVLGDKAYKAAAEDPRTMKVLMFNVDMNTANSYKYYTEPEKLAKLARDLGVDGVIGIHVTFGIAASKSAFSINGISFGKKSYTSTATVNAMAYNQKGEVIWKDSTMKAAEDEDKRAIIVLDTSSFSGADFEKMQPAAIQIGGKSMEVLMTRFEDTMAGKDVERVQSIK